MKEWLLGLFNNFDFNNVYSIVIFSISMIVILANCIGALYATSIEIKLMSKIELLKRTSIILFTLVEVIVSTLLYFNQENTISNIIIEIDDKKWYVFRRIDTQYLLCGDKKELNNSQTTILLELNDIVKERRCFKKYRLQE